jgi:hypothetical protein
MLRRRSLCRWPLLTVCGLAVEHLEIGQANLSHILFNAVLFPAPRLKLALNVKL